MSDARNAPAIVIIGSGFAGLGMAIQLKQAGYHDFVILEKDDDLGGTWRDNTLPGLRLRRALAHVLLLVRAQPRLVPDVRAAAGDLGLHAAVRGQVRRRARTSGTAARSTRMEWDDDDRALARRDRQTGEVYSARAVVSGIGALHVPSIPEIPGAERFTGTAFHSAAVGPRRCDLTGKRVAVIGTGASAIQFVPQIAKRGRADPRLPADAAVDPCPGRTLRSRPRSAPLFAAAPPACGPSATAIYWLLETRAARLHHATPG